MNVETFIRNATRGLSRRKRAEAQAELRSHLHERTNQLILLGKPLPSAQAQAMQELGAPSEIARGLRRTENVHPLLSAAVLTALAGVLVGFPAVDAWLAWRNDSNDGRRHSSTEAELRAEGMVSLPEAARRLRESGVSLKFFGPWAKLEAAGLPTVKLDMSCQQPVYADPGMNRPLPEVRPSHLYVSPETLTGCLASAGWPLEVRPDSVLLQGKTLPYPPQKLPLDSKLSFEQWNNVLQGLLYRHQLNKIIGTSFSLAPFSSGKPAIYRVAAPPQTPVMLLVRASKSKAFPDTFTAFRWVTSNQTVELPTELMRNGLKRDSIQPILLTDDLTKWRSAPDSVNSAILVPLSTNTADPIQLKPLKLTPAE